MVSLRHAAAVAAPTDDASKTATGSLHGVRALVVDDDADSVELTRTILDGAGAEVRVSQSPRAVVATVRDWSPTVLLLDIEMPGEDGYGLLARLRLAGVQAPALALTAYSRPEDRRRALDAGFASFLSKPVAPHDLVAAVASVARAA